MIGGVFVKGSSIFKILSHILTVLLILIMSFLLILVVSSKISDDKVTDVFGYQFRTVLSGSMAPVFKTGSVIAIKEVDKNTTFNVGDIVTYKASDGKLITHRIIKIKNDGETYITKGDSNDAPDAKAVPRENIVGVYTGFTMPYLGYVVKFIKINKTISFMLILPGLLLIGYAFIMVTRAFRNLDIEDENKNFR